MLCKGDALLQGRNILMEFNKFVIFTGLVASLLIITSTYAASGKKKGSGEIKYISKPTDLAAKSFAVKKFGRNINILANRFSKKTGCYKIVIKTKKGNVEDLQVCRK